ncbi:MAG: cobalamin-independent methionine synthase II family protein [Candidatus Binatia bacterium]
MATSEGVKVARADIVGSLLRPEYLLEAKEAMRAGTMSREQLRELEDRAVREAVVLQESAGLEVISDGEFRRQTWVALIPLFDDPLYRAPVSGFEFKEADAGFWELWKEPSGRHVDPVALRQQFRLTKEPFVTQTIRPDRDIVKDEYEFLKKHARARTKFTIPAPSWHRIFWHEDFSKQAYPTSDDFIRDVARFLREEIVARLLALGCDYIQLDAPNYAQWHIDPENRAAFEQHGHDMAHELEADAEFDNMVFAGITGITRAIHICRGNAPNGLWLASGGYEVISRQVFPRLTNFDTLLLEYDTARAGSFYPLRDVLPHHHVVLGLVSTKSTALENAADVEARLREATKYVPLERLALSPQCGFASGEMAHTMTHATQEEKLRLISQVARKVWG